MTSNFIKSAAAMHIPANNALVDMVNRAEVAIAKASTLIAIDGTSACTLIDCTRYKGSHINRAAAIMPTRYPQRFSPNQVIAPIPISEKMTMPSFQENGVPSIHCHLGEMSQARSVPSVAFDQSRLTIGVSVVIANALARIVSSVLTVLYTIGRRMAKRSGLMRSPMPMIA